MTSRREFLAGTAAAGVGMGLGGLPGSGTGKSDASTPVPGPAPSPAPSPAGGVHKIQKAKRPLRILILGGTAFLGPAEVEYALARGHTVTLFNRGQTNPHLFPEVEKLVGDRAAPDYSSLEGREWDAVIDTNLTGTFLISRAAIPELRRRGGGCIINISAISGIHGSPGRVAYSASKGGVVNLTESMALDHAAEHIRVNCICPGPTETPMVNIISPEQRARMDQRLPIGHIGQPEDIAEAALYLASDAARQVDWCYPRRGRWASSGVTW